MTPERWHKVNELFTVVSELDPDQRAAFLDQSCADDQGLRAEVESLLASDRRGWNLIERPAVEVAAPLLANERPQLKPGQIFSHYQIESMIGKGGMGEVYLAVDKLLNRKIALKLLPADYTQDKERLRRFQQEAQAASALNHPNILTIHEIGNIEEQRFIATEFVDGQTLRQRFHRESLTLQEVFEIAIQIASALSAAHQAGIVHRDIKPENIMLRPDGYVKVLDFGLAKLTEQNDRAPQPQLGDISDMSSGLVMGTVKYMSPEQAQGQQVDARSDIFSFGVVLYEMVVGRVPFGEKGGELISAILKNEPSTTNVPDLLEPLISKALRKKKEERYQTMRELLIDLKNLKQKVSLEDNQQTHLSTSAAISWSRSSRETVSTVEYIVSGIKRHKTGAAVVFASLVIVAISFSFGVNRFRRRGLSSDVKIARIAETDKARSVAISPNGEYIAYAEMSGIAKASSEQTLWTINVATHDRIQLAPPTAIDYLSLKYSPDGESIFYVNGEQELYKIQASGGQPTKVLSGVAEAVSFALNGTQIAFVRENGPETALIIANVDGSGERVLATRKTPAFIDPATPAWSPDGSLIVCGVGILAQNNKATLIGFEATTAAERIITNQQWDEFGGQMVWLSDGSGLVTTANQGTESQIWKISYPSGEAHKITTDPNWNYGSLSVTADGKSLIALESASRSSVWIMPHGDVSQAKPITSGEHEEYRHVSWTHDGKILYASNVGASRDLWIMNSDGTTPRQVTTNGGVNFQPDASLDGRYIVFSSNRGQDGAFNLWRVDLDGRNPRQLTHGNGEVQPRFSPDGHWVVYAKGGPTTSPAQKTLWKVAIDGGEPVQLVDKPSMQASFSLDGTMIACWYKPDATTPWRIALIPSAGGPPIKLLDVERTSITPIHWSPNGQSIYYIKSRPFVGNIWSQPIAGGEPTAITQFTSERMEGFDVSPEGNIIAARSHPVQNAIRISNF